MAVLKYVLFILLFVLIGCARESGKAGDPTSLGDSNSINIINVDDAPVAVAITPANFNEDTESVMTLVYSDADSDLATACTISAPSNVTETTACSCDVAGVCTVGVTGTENYVGVGSFNYSVTANSVVSNIVSSTFTIDNVDDAPVAVAITPANFNEDTESVMTLVYSDADSDLATACAISVPSNVTETTACSCDVAGVCTVGVTGTENYVGVGSFNYSVT
ncbi:MAG: hypothetical protein HN576_04055, partial [Bacteriovoracaceae bacterium]|nr:hypothetical protein [Bacteriovoracaceae bacterium]